MKARKKPPPGGARARKKAGRPTPEALLDLVAARDKGALLELFALVAPGLLGLASHVTSNPSDAAAVVEDTFVRLWRQAPQFPRESASVAAWLFLEVRRSAMHKRYHGEAARTPLERALPLFEGSNTWLPGPDEISKLESRRELLKKTLHQLPKPQQEALAMAVWQGLTEGAIAEKTGPIGAYDVLLAGQTRRRGAVLVTSNVREFDRVRGLKWALASHR